MPMPRFPNGRLKPLELQLEGFQFLAITSTNYLLRESFLILYMINKLTLNNGDSLSYQVSKSANKFFTCCIWHVWVVVHTEE